MSLIHYMDVQWVLYWLVGLPLSWYLLAVSVLIFIRLVILFYRVRPYFRRLVSGMIKFADQVSSKPGNRGPNYPNGKRDFSTSAVSRGFPPKTPLSDPEPISSLTPPSSKRKRSGASWYMSTLLRLHCDAKSLQELITVKGNRLPLLNPLKGIAVVAGANTTPGLITFLVSFIRFCRHTVEHNSVRFLASYLKGAQVSLQQSLGGYRVLDPAKIGGSRFSRTSTGLPRILPPHIRARIRSGDVVAIRLSLTLLGLYRILVFPGKLNLSSITAPFEGTGTMDEILYDSISRFVSLFVRRRFTNARLTNLLERFASLATFPIMKGAPGTGGESGYFSTHPMLLLTSFLTLYRDEVLFPAFNILLNALNYKIKGVVVFLVKSMDLIQTARIQGYRLVTPLQSLGKLSTKEEAAGKIRVFAMVDAWTQWILYPYHCLVMSILKGIPMDGTFDQGAPLKRLDTSKGAWSLDLSSATDRLPVKLQKALLSDLFGETIAEA